MNRDFGMQTPTDPADAYLDTPLCYRAAQAASTDPGEDPMAFNALEALREGGTPIDEASDAQRQVLASLSEEEVATINSVKARLEAASGEVTGQLEHTGNNIF